MPGRDEHIRSAERFEAFLKQINHPGQQYREWVVIVWFHIALHYIDAFLATKGHAQIGEHGDRWPKVANYPETREVSEDFHQLYRDAKGARYEGDVFTPKDLEPIEQRYLAVRRAMRRVLGLSA